MYEDDAVQQSARAEDVKHVVPFGGVAYAFVMMPAVVVQMLRCDIQNMDISRIQRRLSE